MRNLSFGTAAAGLLITMLTGCASSPTTVLRGQSPDAYAQAFQESEIELVDYNHAASQRAKQVVQQQIAQRFAGQPEYSAQPQGYVNSQPTYQSANWQTPGPQSQPVVFQQNYQPTYQPNYQQQNMANCPPYDGSGRAIPAQHYKFRYVVPQGLNYPPENAVPGVIQYPYYTVKGPDCFFHQ